MHKFFLFLLVFALPVAGLLAADSPAKQAGSQFDDPVDPLEQQSIRTEQDEDAITASALFAHGRVLFGRRDFAGALRRYQRAWRYDPESVALLDEIVPLAFNLSRNNEAARYAVISAERNPKDPVLLGRLAQFLTEEKKYARAIGLYERVLELQKVSPPDSNTVLQYIEMGRLSFLDGDFAVSADFFAKVIAALNEPDKYSLDEAKIKKLLNQPERTYNLFGESFFRADRFDEAEAMFKKADEAKADAGTLGLHLARIAAKRKQSEAALEHLEKYFESKSKSGGFEAYELLAQLLGETLKDEAKAELQLLERLEKLRAADSENAALGYFLAKRLLEMKKLDEAEAVYAQLIEKQPISDAYSGLAGIYFEQNKTDELLALLAKTANDDGSIQPLGDVADKIAADDARMKQLAESALGENAIDGAALAVAFLAVRAKKFDEADALFGKAVEQAEEKDKPEVMTTWGLEMFMAEQSDRAADIFRRAMNGKLDAEKTQSLRFLLAGALQTAEKDDEAIAVAKMAVTSSPDSVQVQFRLPWMLYQMKRNEEAKRFFINLIDRFDDKHDSPDDRVVLRNARSMLSNIYVHEEQMPEAEEWLEQILDEFPENIGAMNDLGYLWADQGKHLHRSLRMVKLAVAAEPDNIAYRDSLGWAYFRLGRFDEALKELEKAASGDNPDGVILDHLGDAYAQAGQLDKAVETWKKAVLSFEDQDDQKLLKKTQEKLNKHLNNE